MSAPVSITFATSARPVWIYFPAVVSSSGDHMSVVALRNLDTLGSVQVTGRDAADPERRRLRVAAGGSNPYPAIYLRNSQTGSLIKVTAYGPDSSPRLRYELAADGHPSFSALYLQDQAGQYLRWNCKGPDSAPIAQLDLE